MKKFTYTYKVSAHLRDDFNAYFKNLNTCVFDIETTGLSASTGKVIMTAMLTPDKNDKDKVTITQFLAEKYYDEYDVICATIDFLDAASIDCLITYNGASFDIPFMKNRIEKLHIRNPFNFYNFDLLKYIRSYSDIKERLKPLNQKNVEKFLGIATGRYDKISGKDSITLYNEYVVTHDSRLETVLLTHNCEDVLQLYRIFSILFSDNEDLVKFANVDESFGKYGFLLKESALTVKAGITKKQLCITGAQLSKPLNWLEFSSPPLNTEYKFKNSPAAYEITTALNEYDNSLYLYTGNFNFADDLIVKSHINDLDGYINENLILTEHRIKNYKEINCAAALLAIHCRESIKSKLEY